MAQHQAVSAPHNMQAKPDTIANAELGGELTPKCVYGHIPGIRTGQAFRNRGELAITGLHCLIFNGIYSKYACSNAVERRLLTVSFSPPTLQ